VTAGNRLLRIGRALLRCAYWLAALAAFVCLCNYVIDARMRISRQPACQWQSVPVPDDRPYSARWCKLTKDTVLTRLYDHSGTQLLAERTYPQLGTPFVAWAPDRLWYDTYPDDSFIALPPSLIDRLRASLP